MQRLGIELRLGRRWSDVRRAATSRDQARRRHARSRASSACSPPAAKGGPGASGLAEIGVEPDTRGYLKVDERFRPRVFRTFWRPVT